MSWRRCWWPAALPTALATAMLALKTKVRLPKKKRKGRGKATKEAVRSYLSLRKRLSAQIIPTAY